MSKAGGEYWPAPGHEPDGNHRPKGCDVPKVILPPPNSPARSFPTVTTWSRVCAPCFLARLLVPQGQGVLSETFRITTTRSGRRRSRRTSAAGDFARFDSLGWTRAVFWRERAAECGARVRGRSTSEHERGLAGGLSR